MVEIKSHEITAPDEDKYRLIYSKSKVYVNPTAYARDNIPGFVALVKREAANPTCLLAWIPESLLNERGTSEWDKFVKVEERPIQEEEDDDVVLVELPARRPESYAFSVPLTSIYSLVVHPPSLSSWYGTIGINLINGDSLPTLHFHDDESRSITLPSPRSTSGLTYPPPPPPGRSSHVPKPPASWGGEDLLSRLRSYAHILRSTLQSSLFLIDPSRTDVEAHTIQIFPDDAVDDILAQSGYAGSNSPVPPHRRPRPLSSPPVTTNPYTQGASVLHRSLGSVGTSPHSSSQARLALLQSFSNLTRATKHAAQNILSHPLAKPIVPHLPDPVKSLVSAPGEWEWGSWVEKGGVGEFESARVYLARWARIVAEEGERARRQEAQALLSSSTEVEEEDSSLGIFELLHSTSNLPTPRTSRDPNHPLDSKAWASFFDEKGRSVVRTEEIKREIFRRGISSDDNSRSQIWPFLLGVFGWETTAEERQRTWEEKRKEYQRLKSEWCGVPEVFDRQDVLEERHRIDVDCRRTDRNQPLFSMTSSPSPDTDAKANQEVSKRYTTISPNLSDIGAQSPSNEHIDRLAVILLTYYFYEKELGYVQGMSDLCAPLYVIMDGDEEMTFWCFVGFMKHMTQNFLRDQSGMKKQLSALQQLINVMDPELYRHLEKTDSLNLFFCFRWVLIAFKREFPFEDVIRLWEVLWTDYYSRSFVIFVALAILESHRDVILRYLVEFDEILKYCNELSMTIELDSTLAQAEVLFLSFSQLVVDIDRRAQGPSTSGLRRRGAGATTNAAANMFYVKYIMSNLNALRTLALKDPSTIPKSILYSHTATSLVIFDAYPKSIFHFLVLPRVYEPFTIEDLTNLRSLLRTGENHAKELVQELKSIAESLKHDIEKEMVRYYGFKWGIWMGFHGAPSMVHLHLHVLSADLCSEKMKNKKHYNSFHPELGFFLDIETVLSWFDATPSYQASMINTNQATYEKILKEPLSCFRCSKGMKNMPTLKEHLQEEWELLAKRERLKAEKRKKLGTGQKQLLGAGPTQHEEDE